LYLLMEKQMLNLILPRIYSEYKSLVNTLILSLGKGLSARNVKAAWG
jgi:hypothetical protein